MNGYVLVDNSTNIVHSAFSWNDSKVAESYITPVGYSLLKLEWTIFTEVQNNIMGGNSLLVINKDGSTFDTIFQRLVSDLDIAKQNKKDELNQQCEFTILGGFDSTNGHHYRTNRDDQTNMIGQKDKLVSDTTIVTVMWKTEDAGYISHTRDEWMAIYNEAFDFKQQQLFKYDKLKKDVDACTTPEGVNSIQW